MNTNVFLHTSMNADANFKDLCRADGVTFDIAMDYLRQPNHPEFRERTLFVCIRNSPLKLKIEMQCRIEGLLG